MKHSSERLSRVRMIKSFAAVAKHTNAAQDGLQPICTVPVSVIFQRGAACLEICLLLEDAARNGVSAFSFEVSLDLKLCLLAMELQIFPKQEKTDPMLQPASCRKLILKL